MIGTGTIFDEHGEIIPDRLPGLGLSDAINAIYRREVDRQLARNFDVLLDGVPPDGALEMIGGIIAELYGADPELDRSNIRKAAMEWLASVRSDQTPVIRAKALAELALGPAFWKTLDGDGFAVEFEIIDPLSHYDFQQVAWDRESGVLLRTIQASLGSLRANWLGGAAAALFTTIATNPDLRLMGIDGAAYGRDGTEPEAISPALFDTLPRSWKLHRVGSRLEVLNSDGSKGCEFRGVTIRDIGDSTTHTDLQPEIEEKAMARDARGNPPRSGRRGQSYVSSDRTWIEAMRNALVNGHASNVTDAARAVVDKKFEGKGLKGTGSDDSKVSRLSKRYTGKYGPWIRDL